jgi:dynein heavy chain 1, cytosolic
LQPHYLYSPRELTRWKFALYEAVKSNEAMTPDTLVRLYVHEGLRIFQDRLVEKFEREWTDETINGIAKEVGCLGIQLAAFFLVERLIYT